MKYFFNLNQKAFHIRLTCLFCFVKASFISPITRTEEKIIMRISVHD